jgi:hypothetical protein
MQYKSSGKFRLEAHHVHDKWNYAQKILMDFDN